jgi:hypothetical protein
MNYLVVGEYLVITQDYCKQNKRNKTNKERIT